MSSSSHISLILISDGAETDLIRDLAPQSSDIIDSGVKLEVGSNMLFQEQLARLVCPHWQEVNWLEAWPDQMVLPQRRSGETGVWFVYLDHN